MHASCRHLLQARGEIAIAEDQRYGGESAGAGLERSEADRIARVQSARLFQREGNSFLKQKLRLLHHVAMASECNDEIRPRLAAQLAEVGISSAAKSRRQCFDAGGVGVADADHLDALDLESGVEIERQVPVRGSYEGEFHGSGA